MTQPIHTSPLTRLYNSDTDAMRFERRVLLITGALWGHLALVTVGVLPAWTFVLVVPPLFVRWLGAIHEISHVWTPDKVSLPARAFLLLTGPLVGGYREMRAEHMGHHRHALQDQDPTNYLVRGGPVRAAVMALTAPEQLLWRTARAHGVDSAMVRESALRAALFAAAALTCQGVFLAYFLTLRLTYACAFFVFFRALHRRGAATGIYELSLPAPVVAVLTPVFGAEVVNAIVHHDLHHHYARVAARDLPAARAALTTNPAPADAILDAA